MAASRDDQLRLWILPGRDRAEYPVELGREPDRGRPDPAAAGDATHPGERPLPRALETLLEPLRGHPDAPCAGRAEDADARGGTLPRAIRSVIEKVAQFLRAMDYSLQGNRKTEEVAYDIPTAMRSSSTSIGSPAGRWPGGDHADLLVDTKKEGVDRVLPRTRAGNGTEASRPPSCKATISGGPSERAQGLSLRRVMIWPATRGS